MDDAISQAKMEYTRAKERMAHALATTPEDRLNWSPSETARTPVQIVAHAASAVQALNGLMDGKPFEKDSPAAADPAFRAWEKQFTSREQAVALLNEVSGAYIAWLDALTPDRLGSMVALPFGLGQAPLAFVITFPAEHMRQHTAQIDYLQTIFGDRDWHV